MSFSTASSSARDSTEPSNLSSIYRPLTWAMESLEERRISSHREVSSSLSFWLTTAMVSLGVRSTLKELSVLLTRSTAMVAALSYTDSSVIYPSCWPSYSRTSRRSNRSNTGR